MKYSIKKEIVGLYELLSGRMNGKSLTDEITRVLNERTGYRVTHNELIKVLMDYEQRRMQG